MTQTIDAATKAWIAATLANGTHACSEEEVLSAYGQIAVRFYLSCPKEIHGLWHFFIAEPTNDAERVARDAFKEWLRINNPLVKLASTLQ